MNINQNSVRFSDLPLGTRFRWVLEDWPFHYPHYPEGIYQKIGDDECLPEGGHGSYELLSTSLDALVIEVRG